MSCVFIQLHCILLQGDCDFSPEAIKQYHDKPTPTREKHYGEAKGHGNAVSRHGQARGIFIHQPK